MLFFNVQVTDDAASGDKSPVDAATDDVSSDHMGAVSATGELCLSVDVEPEESLSDQRSVNGMTSATANQVPVLHVLLILLIM